MFFYDHLKVFVRGPGEDTGLNIWVSPLPGDGEAFAWGGRQRTEPAAGLPVRAASRARPGVYTYELALPWSWLGLHPFPEMVLDAMFLVTDSDRPRESLHGKIALEASGREVSKWIWWRHRVILSGEPAGLEPPPPPPKEPESPLERPVSEPPGRPGVGPGRGRHRPPAGAPRQPGRGCRGSRRSGAGSRSRGKGGARPAPEGLPGQRRCRTGNLQRQGAQPSGPPGSVESLRLLGARNRSALARPPGIEIPPWVEEIERAEGMSAADRRHRGDPDPAPPVEARSAGDRRPHRHVRHRPGAVDPHRAGQGEDVPAPVDGSGPAGDRRAGWSAAPRGGGRGWRFRRSSRPRRRACSGEILAEWSRLYREEKVSTTKDLVKKARKRARLDEQQADRFLKTLLIW